MRNHRIKTAVYHTKSERNAPRILSEVMNDIDLKGLPIEEARINEKILLQSLNIMQSQASRQKAFT
jgi:hypothetical protein